MSEHLLAAHYSALQFRQLQQSLRHRLAWFHTRSVLIR